MKVIFAFLISVLASVSFASDRFYKPTDKITFTYDEFRQLSAQHQAEWIKELRNFNRNVDLVVEGQRLTTKKPKFWSFLEQIQIRPAHSGLCVMTRTLMGSLEAHAENANCTMKKQMYRGQEEICLSCPGDLVSGKVDECVPNDGNPDNISFNLLAKVFQKGNKNAKLMIDPKKLTELAKVTIEKDTVNFQANKENLETSAAKKSVRPVDVTPLPAATAERLVRLNDNSTPEGVLKTERVIRKVEKTTKEELKPISGSSDALKEKMAKLKQGGKSLQDLGDKGSNDDLDSDEITKSDRLACIYAGWAVQTDGGCKPITEKTLYDANGKKVTYSCKPGGVTSDTVIYGNNEDGNAIVLCNPVIFGLLEGKPICIKRSKNATEECAGLAGPAEEALAIARQNPEEYRALNRRTSSLCQTSEEKLRAHFEKRGKSPSQIDYAIKDLSTTCTHLRGRMAQIEEANKNSGSAGVR